jgi:hypothetical protein
MNPSANLLCIKLCNTHNTAEQEKRYGGYAHIPWGNLNLIQLGVLLRGLFCADKHFSLTHLILKEKSVQ